MPKRCINVGEVGQLPNVDGEFDLIVTIVSKGKATHIVEAARDQGAEGGTIMFGRGTGIRETQRIFNIPIEPEKEIVFTIVPQHISQQVAEAIEAAADLAQPGNGIAFVIELKSVFGISHLLPPDVRARFGK